MRLLAERRADQARQASGEAVDLYRRLVAAPGADFRWHLATALITHSTNIAADERPGITVSPAIADDDGTVHDSVQLNWGYTNESLAAVTEGAGLLAQLYDESPARYRLDMVRALRSFALRLAQYGCRERAASVAEQGCQLSGGVEASVPALVERAKVHLVLADLRSESAQPQAALEAADVAAADFETLMTVAPEFTAWYAKALHRCAAALEASGDHAAAATRSRDVLSLWLAHSAGRTPSYGSDIDDVVELYARAHSAVDGTPSQRRVADEILGALDSDDLTPLFESLLAREEAEELWNLARSHADRATRRGDDRTAAKCLSWMALAAVLGGRYELAIGPAEQAAALARRSGDAFREAFALVYLGNALRSLDRQTEAAEALSTAVQKLPSGQHGRVHAVALISLAQVTEQLGSTRRARELYRSAAALAGELGFTDIESGARMGVDRLRS